MNEKILLGIGLSLEQAKIYLYLLEVGLAPAKVIASKTSLGRALAYKILDQLIELGLAEKREDIGSIARFSATHPKKLKELAEDREEKAKEAKLAFENTYGFLASSFNLLSGKPNIQFFEGVAGLQRVYSDILEEGKDIRVVSSPAEDRKGVLHLIREQIEKQAEKNIRTKSINPSGDHEPATPVSEDEKYLITRKIVPEEHLRIPAQIIIYGEKVAITNFKEGLVTVVMESKYIRETFEKMFEYIWNHS